MAEVRSRCGHREFSAKSTDFAGVRAKFADNRNGWRITPTGIVWKSEAMIRVNRDFTSETAQLAELRRLVRDCGQRAWPEAPPETFHRLELAIQEAAANIVLHAYKGKPGQPIH